MRTIGILLIIIGAIGLIWGGITYIKDRDTVDLGVATITTTKKGRIHIPPAVSGGALVLGGLLVGLSVRKKRDGDTTVAVSDR
jgi:hypothetical protein